MLLGAAGEAGRISNRAQRCSTTIHIAINTTFAAIDDIATARQHGSAAPPLPPHHRRQTATPPALERRTGGSRRSRSGRRSFSAGRSLSPAHRSLRCRIRSERYRQGHAARSVERGSIGLDPVAEQHHLIFTKKNSPPPAIAPRLSRALLDRREPPVFLLSDLRWGRSMAPICAKTKSPPPRLLTVDSPRASAPLHQGIKTTIAPAGNVEAREDGVEICNLAGWANRDQHGERYLTVELSPRFVSKETQIAHSDLDWFINGGSEDTHH